jgi:hypothetical protein
MKQDHPDGEVVPDSEIERRSIND